MTREELESKHLAELHELAAEAGLPRYRMLQRGELVKQLADGGDGQRPEREEKPRREPRERGPRPEAAAPAPAAGAEPATPKRKRRRRRWGRRRKEVQLHDLLLPGGQGRQAIVYAESRAGCTALLREVAAGLADASKGAADPIALLIDPSPEELAEWRREAPQAEIVAASQARHADDALAQAATRANAGEEVVVLIDSLSRFATEFAGAEEAKDLFDAGLSATAAAGGSLTVVAAVERSA